MSSKNSGTKFILYFIFFLFGFLFVANSARSQNRIQDIANAVEKKNKPKGAADKVASGLKGNTKPNQGEVSKIASTVKNKPSKNEISRIANSVSGKKEPNPGKPNQIVSDLKNKGPEDKAKGISKGIAKGNPKPEKK